MKTKLVPFDIEKAKNGAKVVTNDGRPVKILEYNLRLQNGGTSMLALVNMRSYDDTYHFYTDGRGFPYTLFIEGEIESNMTKQELADWLRDAPEEHREYKYEKGDNRCYSVYDYSEEDANTPADNILIRRNHSEWMEPLVGI